MSEDQRQKRKYRLEHEYRPQEIEARWRAKWEADALYCTDLGLTSDKPKFYNLMEFPYPSAEGLHIGHVYTYSGADVNGRFQRMRGHEVFEPMGFDAFGIHSENYALKQNINPKQLTARTTRRYREDQLSRIGAMFDWQHSVDTSSPDYYRWTQWIFLKLFKAGLAVRKKAPVNWCPSCLTVLAEEQIEDGRCERCSTEVTQRELTQWFFRITEYADRLLGNLGGLDWPEESKIRQANWIGRSEGAELTFRVADSDAAIAVFTTRPETVFGATYVVLAPEHDLVDALTTDAHRSAVSNYVEHARHMKEVERTSEGREKTGVFTGSHAINPATGQRVPVWVADYVLAHYGTGSIMAVPAHDKRDHAFAEKFNLPFVNVVELGQEVADDGSSGGERLINSGQFDGLETERAKILIVEWLKQRELAVSRVTYRLRDWLISRQRYWGPPIPIVYCSKDGIVPVPEDQLPVLLPEIENFRPTGTGKSPLASLDSFYNTTCPICGGRAVRETDVSDTFLDSAWYFLRYPSADSADHAFTPERTSRWLPVDMYFGGKEHVVRHHLYARFITMVLHDLGYLGFEEPFTRLRLHGFVTKDGAKMSKSRGNVVNPDDYISRVGSDGFRSYLLFMGPYDQDNDFSDRNLVGVTRFLERVWRLVVERPLADGPGEDLRPLHRFVMRLTKELDTYQYHTALAALMEFSNWIASHMDQFTLVQRQDVLKTITLLLAPFAPHLAEELWQRLGGAYSVHQQPWPKFKEETSAEKITTLIVQVNGRLRDRLTVPIGISEEEARSLALQSRNVAPQMANRVISKTVWVPGKVINLVTQD